MKEYTSVNEQVKNNEKLIKMLGKKFRDRINNITNLKEQEGSMESIELAKGLPVLNSKVDHGFSG